MASKRNKRRQREAAERKTKEKLRVKWDAQNARWINEQGQPVDLISGKVIEEAKPEPPRMFLYNVAVQKGEGKDILCNEFMAPSDEDVLELICKHHSVDKESEFTILDVHKYLDGSILIIRETDIDTWPPGCKVVTNKGIIMRGQWAAIGDARRAAMGADRPVQSYKKTVTNATTQTPTTPPPSWKVEGETYIPRVKYTLKTGT